MFECRERILRSFPQFENKYLLESLFTPKEYLNYKKLKYKNFPKKILFVYRQKLEKYFIRKYKPKKIKIASMMDLLIYKNMGLVRMKGIGSPHAVTVFEELIGLGGKIFLNIGTAGGLNKYGIFVCNKALRDEGTSHHYLSNDKFSYPDENLTNSFGKYLLEKKLKISYGTTWTIDAPYRETKKEVEHYAKEGISTVEMEASALFAVAKYRNVKIASAFVVSDFLGKKWNPKFHNFDVEKSQKDLLDASVSFLVKEHL